MIQRIACVLLLLFSASAAVAQRVDPPPTEQGKWYISVFTHSDWEQRPQEKALLESFAREPLAGLKKGVHYKHYTELEPVYASGRFPMIPVSDFPVVILSDSRGGYIYKASKNTMPTPGEPLFMAMREAYQRDKAIPAEPVVPIPEAASAQDSTSDLQQDDIAPYVPPSPDFNRDPVFPNAPWNQDEAADDPMEFFFGGDTPIRDSLGYAAWIAGAVLAMFFLSVLFIGGIVVVGFAVVAIRAFVK